MTVQDIKLTILNGVVVGLTFSNIEIILKIILLLVSIGYTSLKTYEFYINKIKNNDGSNNNNED